MPARPEAGWIDATLAGEVPGLGLVSALVEAPESDDSES